jgi:alpha-1,6-rhamnosyltransferase
MSRITVIMPCYNGEEWVADAIESVLNQDCPDFEVILVDDGSTDSTPEIVQRYGDDRRFKVLRKSNGGVGSARNLGMDHCTGEYFLFLDADDELLPGCLSNMVERLDAHPEAVATFGRFLIYDEGTGKRFPVNNMFPPPDLDVPGFVEFMLKYGMYYRLDAVAYRMSAVKDLRFDTKMTLGQDFKFILEMATRGQHVAHEQYCSVLRRGHDSITRLRSNFTYRCERQTVIDFYRTHEPQRITLRNALSWQHVRFSKRYQGNHFFKAWKHAVLALVLNPMNIYAYKHMIGQLVLQRPFRAMKYAK